MRGRPNTQSGRGGERFGFGGLRGFWIHLTRFRNQRAFGGPQHNAPDRAAGVSNAVELRAQGSKRRESGLSAEDDVVRRQRGRNAFSDLCRGCDENDRVVVASQALSV